MPGRIYPNEKKKLLKMLAKEDLAIIKKDYPYKRLRDAKIHELGQKGVSYTILAELTGLSKSTVHRLGQTGKNARTSKVKKYKNPLMKFLGL